MTVTTELPVAIPGSERTIKVEDDVAGFIENAPVTPVGQPVAVRLTAALNPLDGKMKILDAPAPPCATVTFEAVSAKLEPALTVNSNVVLAVADPPAPLINSGYVPEAIEAPTVIVSRELVDPGLGENVPLIPAGQFEVAMITVDTKPFFAAIVTAAVPVNPAEIEVGGADTVNPGGALTINDIVAVAERDPLTPPKVTEYVPPATVEATVRETAVVVLAGFTAKDAVTPAGKLVAESVTGELNWLKREIVMVAVPVCPMIAERLVAARENPGAAVTVMGIGTVAVAAVAPVPTTGRAKIPALALAGTDTVITEDRLIGFTEKVGMNPAGQLAPALRVTGELNPLYGNTEIVEVPMDPVLADAEEAFNVNPGVPLPPVS